MSEFNESQAKHKIILERKVLLISCLSQGLSGQGYQRLEVTTGDVHVSFSGLVLMLDVVPKESPGL